MQVHTARPAGVMTGIAALVDETVDQFEAGALAAPAGMELVRIAGERDRGQFIEGAARHYQRWPWRLKTLATRCNRFHVRKRSGRLG